MRRACAEFPDEQVPRREWAAPPAPPPPARPTRDTWAGAGDSARNAPTRDFICEASAASYEFEKPVALAPDVSDAVRWVAERAPGVVREARESAVWRIVTRARQLEQSGAIEEWYRGADAGVRGVAWHVNGPLLHELAVCVGHVDRECVELIRQVRSSTRPLARGKIGRRAQRGRPSWAIYQLLASSCRTLSRGPKRSRPS